MCSTSGSSRASSARTRTRLVGVAERLRSEVRRDVVHGDAGDGAGLDGEQMHVVAALDEEAQPALGVDVASDGQVGDAQGPLLRLAR